MEKVSKYKKLKNVLKREIYSYLSWKDLCVLWGLEKSFMIYLTENNCSNLKCSSLIYFSQGKPDKNIYFDFFKEIGPIINNFQEIITNNFYSEPTIIPIIGYKCEGGVFSEYYHYNNLFKITSYEFYCSKPQIKNFNVYSALIPEFYSYGICNIEKAGLTLNPIKLKKFIQLHSNANYFEINFPKIITFFDQRISEKKRNLRYPVENINSYKITNETLLDDSHILNRYSSNDYFCLNFLYLRNTGPYTCPGKTLIFLIYDNIILNEADELLLSALKEMKTENDLLNFIQKKDYLKIFPESKKNSEIYKSYEFDTLIQRQRNINLKLLLWIQLASKNEFILNLKRFIHYGKYVVIKFIDSIKTHYRDDNIDFSKTLFFGDVLQLKK